MSKIDDLQIDGKLWVVKHSPGDGATRYRFFDKPQASFFGPGNGIYTVLGFKQADIFSNGFACGLVAGERDRP